MAEALPPFDEADVARRASGLLQAFFTDHPNLRQTVLDAAFKGLRHDPRRLIETGGSAAIFASECVTQLLAYGCSDQGRHSLARLLEVIREDHLGANPHPDYIDLPRLLNRLCALPSREDEHAYLDRLLADIQRKADLYAPLRGLARIMARADGGPLRGAWDDLAPLRHLRRPSATQQPGESRDFGDILTAFGQVKRAALLGRPGAGKTTTLNKLAAELAQRAKSDAGAPLPLLVSLGDWTGDELLPAFLTSHLPEIGWALNALSGAKRAVLLLDGLNEIPTQQRQAKAQQVRALMGKLEKGTPVYVSCRADDYVGELDLGLDTLTLQPLSPPQVRAVLHHWVRLQFGDAGTERAERLFWQLAGDPALVGVLATWLAFGGDEGLFWEDIGDSNVYGKITWEEARLRQQHVRNPRSLIRLAANPFMLTMLFWVWLDRDETLPRNRGELFARFVDALLEREHLAAWDEATGCCRYALEGEELLAGLADLAWSMQTRRIEESGAERTGDAGVLTAVSRQEAVGVLGNESLVKKAEDATVLEGQAEIRFRHQLLQEYFMALVLKRQFEQGSLSAARLWPADRWWARSGWEEAAVLLAGLFPEDCAPIIHWLTDAQPEVTVQCLLESGAEIADRNTLFAGLRTAWLPRLTDPECEPEPPARAAVGRALGRLNLDNRKGIGLDTRGVPDIDWVEVPAGDFVYQDGERRYLETFWIGRYPITNAQFDAFIQDRGYEDDRWWRGLGEHIRAPEAPGWTLANHPRETVSWYEAMAFCAWLTHRLGYAVTLPTEVQWEKAARGTDGRTYPWGVWRASKANSHEADIGRTSAVGLFPHGRSPYGVMDLTGNVWEWCLTEQIQREGCDYGMLCGGSFLDRPTEIHITDRRAYSYNSDIGFRVVCVVPIPSAH
jgi:hypothetical protein